MAKTRSLFANTESKPTTNKKTTKPKQTITKKKSLLDIKGKNTNNTTPQKTVNKSKPTKLSKPTTVKTSKKTVGKITNISKDKQPTTTSKLTETNILTKSVTSPTTSSNWVKSSTRLPEELRPIEFNTKHKKPVYGYRLNHYNYITNTPYFIDKFKQQNGYLEWKYIPYCTSLNRCPKEFPDCDNCKIAKKKGK